MATIHSSSQCLGTCRWASLSQQGRCRSNAVRWSRRPVVPRAQQPEPKAPKGVTQPPQQPATPPALFGFVDNAERQNSRAAMIGFFSLLLLEFVTKQGILELLGLRVGGGLGFEF